ncbi:MAG: hypothetical protein KJO21_04045 [Verrucomicrobiae bacterium]|nr:hypothetical protein [Verrucomicrobiae bacterium]NNJ42671.1 hypothetical protein [Akkermansiaceae bacterium]
MKLNTKTLIAVALCGFAPTTLLAEEKKHKHDHKEHAGHDHKEHAVKGPNNGRMIMKVEPHAEFFVTKDRKVQITFVDDDGKKVPVGNQKVTIICGDRSNPTTLKMVKKDGMLVSSNTLPKGNDYPTVVSIKSTPDAKTVREKFNLNMSECPTCDNKEYHCSCDHGAEKGGGKKEGNHKGHDH